MQAFKVIYSIYVTHVVSEKMGSLVVPRLLNHFRPQIPLTRIFDTSDKLTIKEVLPSNISVEEVTLDYLYDYLLKRNGNELAKYAPKLRDAWHSFHEGNQKRTRQNRKLTEAQVELMKELLDKKTPKAQIAKQLGISRTGLYKAIEKLEQETLLKRCHQGYLQEYCDKAYKNCPKDSPWWIRAKAKRDAKVELFNKLIGFDLAELKSKSVNLREFAPQ